MFSSKRVANIIALFEKRRFKETIWYSFVLFISFLISVSIFILYNDQNKSIAIRHALIAFVIISVALIILIFTLNEVKKFFSVRAVLQAIELAKLDNWDWSSVSYLYKPSLMYSSILAHPVTIFLFAKKLEKDGYNMEANHLLKKAINKDPLLKNVEIKKGGVQYLSNQIIEGKFSKTIKMIDSLWNKKLFRYPLLFIVVVLFLLYLLSQFSNIKG